MKVKGKFLSLDFKNIHTFNTGSPLSSKQLMQIPAIKDDKNRISEHNFEKYYNILLENYNRHKYRKIFEFLDAKQKIYDQTNRMHDLFFSHMKMNCILNIITKKLNKYIKTPIIKGVEKWFNYANELVNKLSELIFELTDVEKIPQQCELVLYYHIKIIYLSSLYFRHNNNFKDYISNLILAQEIIKDTIDKITFPDTFIYIIRIYLLISNLLIQDDDIFSAINYLVSSIQICKVVKSSFYEIRRQNEIKSWFSNKFFLTHINNNHYDYDIKNKEHVSKLLKEINFLLTINFCQMAICFENLDDFYLSNTAYKQAEWIATNEFKGENYDHLIELFKQLSEKSTREKVIILTLCQINMDKFIQKIKGVTKKPKLPHILKNPEKELKFQNIENFINKLNLKESENINQLLSDLKKEDNKKNKNSNLNKLTENIVLLNYLSSEEFKPVLYDIKDFNFFNMNKDTEMLISRKLSLIKDKKEKQYQYMQSKDNNSSLNNFSFSHIYKIHNFCSSDKIWRNIYDQNMNNNTSKNNEQKNHKPSYDLKLDDFPINESDPSQSNNKDNSFQLPKITASNTNMNSLKYLNQNSIVESSKNENDDSESNDYYDNIPSSKCSFEVKSLKKSINLSLTKNNEKSKGTPCLGGDEKSKKIINNYSSYDHTYHNNNNFVIKKNKKKKFNIPIPKYINDKYIFCNKYTKKNNKLEDYFNKEIQFQKNLLKSKSYEKVVTDFYDPEKQKKNAELFFAKCLDDRLKLLEKKIIIGPSSEKRTKRKVKVRKERSSYFIKQRFSSSFNFRNQMNYKQLFDNIQVKKYSVFLQAEMDMMKLKKYKPKHFSFENPSKKNFYINNHEMNVLDYEIDQIDKKINKCKLKQKKYEKFKPIRQRLFKLSEKDIKFNNRYFINVKKPQSGLDLEIQDDDSIEERIKVKKTKRNKSVKNLKEHLGKNFFENVKLRKMK